MSPYAAMLTLGALALSGCQGTPQLGQGGSVVQGSGGAGGTQGASAQLTHCDRPVGTAALAEPQGDTSVALGAIGLQSPVPLLRLMMAQSGCFRVVDRGAAIGIVQQEEGLARSGLLKSGKSKARGKLVDIDYVITPNVIFSNPDAGGAGGAAGLGGLFGGVGVLAGAVAGSMRIQEAQTVLFAVDAETGVQEAVAEGSAQVRDFGGMGGLGGFGGGIGGLARIGGYGNTAEGKLIAAAFLDAHNKLVGQIRALRPQS